MGDGPSRRVGESARGPGALTARRSPYHPSTSTPNHPRQPLTHQPSPITLLLALLAIWLIDRWLGRGPHALLPTGVADETAHLLTTLLILAALPWPLSRWFVAGALVGSVAIDIDHLPLLLGSDVLTRETNRPLTHGLLTVAIVAGLAAMLPPRWRAAALGAALGLGAHLLRDMATSTAGAPLLWPLETHGFQLPYVLYVGLLAICALIGVARRASARDSPVFPRRANGEPTR